MADKSKNKADTAKGVQARLADGAAGLFSAGKGLYLKVSAKGAGSWVYRYQLNGKPEKIGIGSVRAFTLAEARDMADEYLRMVKRGENPKIHRVARAEAKQAIFDVLVAEYIEAHRHGWKNEKHTQQWHNTLKTYASPIIGQLPAESITTEHVLEILKPIWQAKPETARRVRNRIELVLDSAKARGLRSGDNPARWRDHLKFLLAAQMDGVDKKHQAALPWQQIESFWQALCALPVSSASQALQFTILAACRTQEALQAQWSEFDMAAGVWTIPAGRMKASREHRVPLSQQAADILNAIPRTGSPFVFESVQQGKPLSGTAMLEMIKRLHSDKAAIDGIGWIDPDGRRITTHGFRSTFRDWLGDTTNTPRNIAEAALSHALKDKTEAAYNRTDLLEKRRALMKAWGQYVVRLPANNVTQLQTGNKP